VTFPDDPHLNEQGNALVASWVLAHLQGLGLLP